MAAALACREGELVSLTLVTDRLPGKTKKPVVVLVTVLSVIFTVILFKYGMDKVLTQLANGKKMCIRDRKRSRSNGETESRNHRIRMQRIQPYAGCHSQNAGCGGDCSLR